VLQQVVVAVAVVIAAVVGFLFSSWLVLLVIV